MPTTSDLERKCETAFIAWLANTGDHSITLPVAARHADEDDEMAIPRIIVSCTNATEEFRNSGVYRVQTDVIYVTNAHDTEGEDANDDWGNLRAILNWDTLADELSDTENFRCWGVLRDQGTRHQIDEDKRVKIFPLTVFCQVLDGVGGS